MSSAAFSIGLARGAYPERRERRLGWLDREGSRIGRLARCAARSIGSLPRSLPAQVDLHTEGAASLDAAALRDAAGRVGLELRRGGLRPELVARAFALVREAAGRTIGQRHYDTQLMGGWVLLSGMVAEMETGEGKTLCATLAASTAALAGIPTHVVTVNDYLATRDAEWMGPVYQALGLTVGGIRQGMSPDARRAAYACDVTYCSNKELAFDYLKDRITLGRNPGRIALAVERVFAGAPRSDRLVLRGLGFAIVDEADSVLIDEARTPLIISQRVRDALELGAYEDAVELARELLLERDFVVHGRERRIELSEAGREALDSSAERLGGIWRGRRRREELIARALTALHVLERDVHYIVRDGEVQIVDEFTGRTMPDRSWEQGLHQLVEVKEGLEVSGRHEPRARISYQRFFRRYVRLAGMTGTAREVRAELADVYGLPVVRIPTERPGRRERLPQRIFATRDETWQAIATRVAQLHAAGRPVLVGTRSVAASEELSRRLEEAGVEHRILNARQDAGEADVVARAGEAGRVTVATNMAGRGTDIALQPLVAEAGGLHVIASEHHEARRIDRQLAGRCARQGDPGSFEQFASLEDEIFTRHAGRLWSRLGGHSRYDSWALRGAQRRAERLHARIRRRLLRMDEQLEMVLAFSGGGE